MNNLTKLLLTQILLCVSLFASATNINISVNPPSSVSACKKNQFRIDFSSTVSNVQLTITDSLLNVSNPSCNGSTKGVYFLIDSISSGTYNQPQNGDTLRVTIASATSSTKLYYSVYIDCHIVNNSSVALKQMFTSTTASTTFTVTNGNANYLLSSGVLKPSIIPSTTNSNSLTAYYLTDSDFVFSYINTLAPVSIRFKFIADSNYCNTIQTKSIKFKKGINGALYNYSTANPNSDTVTLGTSDTLFIKQRVAAIQCIDSAHCGTKFGYFSWQCNISDTAISNYFCNDCYKKDTIKYIAFNGDNINVDIQRISPAATNDALRELSCYNDTSGMFWSYRVVNTGNAALDTVSFKLAQLALDLAGGDISFLSLIDSSTLHISLSQNHICTIKPTMSIRSFWLCSNFISRAIDTCFVGVKNFGKNDTIYISFKTFRCSQNYSPLLNVQKKYNRWTFAPVGAGTICNAHRDAITNLSGLFSNAISGQSAGGSGYDFDLHINYFPVVNCLSVSNAGIGDSALLSMDLKGLVSNQAANVYQLLGCNDPQPQCDTLYGYLRATVFCDTNLRIPTPAIGAYLMKIKSNADTLFSRPIYYYTSNIVSDSICRRTYYYYYFNLADSGMRSIIDSGQFQFRVQACCGSDMAKTPYSVTFHILPNPNNCFTLNYSGFNHLTPPDTNNVKGKIDWLPLSDKGNQIAVLCPGCLAPGIISNFYKIKRASPYGLQDTDNDGTADGSFTTITDTSIWYGQFGNSIKKDFSGLGDRLQDFLRANMVDGDKTSGGYTQAQLDSLHLRFNVLEVARIIPMGVDTMKLTPDSIIFYVDDPNDSTNGCLECAPYGMLPNDFTTMLRLNIGPADVSSFLIGTSTSPSSEFRYAFTSYFDSTLNHPYGNLHNHPYITHNNGSFTGFRVGQYYRMSVFYKVCGNYQPPINFTVDDVVRESDILNRAFLCGQALNVPSDNIQYMPNTEDTLHHIGIGYTVYPDSVQLGYTLVDTNFVNSYMFMCEATGSIHYFYSNVAANSTPVYNTDGCYKNIIIKAASSLADSRPNLDFPFEYKPPVMLPHYSVVNIPNGFHVDKAFIRNEIVVNNSSVTSDTSLITLPNNSGQIIIDYAAISQLHCLGQNNNAPYNDSLFLGDQKNTVVIDLKLLPDSCLGSSIAHSDASDYLVTFTPQFPACIQNTACSNTDSSFSYTSGSGINGLTLNPNLTLNGIQTPSVLITNDTICWKNISIEHVDNNDSTLTRADNIYIAIDSVPYFTNWFFQTGGQTIYPNGNVFGIKPFLEVDSIVTGNLCAVLDTCPPDTSAHSFKVYFGWNCVTYPASPYNYNLVCEYDTFRLSYSKAIADLNVNSKAHDSIYTLCDTISVSAPFTSYNHGYVFADSVSLQNLSPYLQIANAIIIGPTGTAHLFATAFDSLWYIPADTLNKVCTDGGIHDGGSTGTLQIIFQLIPLCAFAGDTILPDITLHAHDFCGTYLSKDATFSNTGSFIWNHQTQCEDCYALSKTATDTVAYTTQPFTYYIHYCNYSATTDTVVISDLLPPNFTLTSIIPSSTILASMQCDSLAVTGIFATGDTCPNTTNTALLIHNSDTLSATACVPVINICSVTDTVFADSTSNINSHTYNNISILIAGTYFVYDSLTLNNCTVYVNPGGQIITDTGAVFTNNNTTFQSCDTMWQGLRVEHDAKLKILNNSIIYDANDGITANITSTVTVDSSKIIDCIRGIFAPPASGIIGTTINVSRTSIFMQSSTFKPDYIGQPSHGKIPKAGMEINNMVMTLGGTFGKQNEFYKLNTGVVAHNSRVTVKRSKFHDIAIDTYYTEAYHGAAIVSDALTNFVSKLTVSPEVSVYNTVNNCYRGIYSNGSILNVQYVHLLNVTHGIYGTNTPAMRSSMVNNCTITASTTGLYFISNPLASGISLNYNNITITGITPSAQDKKPSQVAIHMSEMSQGFVSYAAVGDTIRLINAKYGIYSANLNRPQIKFNKLEIDTSSFGISVSHNYQSSVNCNSVKGHYTSGASQSSRAFSTTNNSDKTSIYCNTVDSTARGFHFGGINPSSVFKGNNMYHHYNGLYITNGASYMGQQFNAGNKWNGPFAGIYGAVNMASPLYVLNSRFDVDSNLSAVYKPLYLAAGPWFHLGGAATTFNCGSSTVCNSPPPSLTDSALNAKIANGTLESEDYAEESKAIAEEYLYNELKNDSSLGVDDSTYLQFMIDNASDPTGYLYDAEEYLRAAYEFDTVYLNLIDSANALIDIYTDSLSCIQQNNCSGNADDIAYHLDFLRQTIDNLNILRDATVNNTLAEAELQNGYVVNAELPEQNSAYINDIEIQYLAQDNNIRLITDNYDNILAIAQQCPLAGGAAVERARTFVAMVNDTMSYDDDNNCLANGIYRHANADSAVQVIREVVNKILIKPNPANDKIEIVLNGTKEGLCKIAIKNSLGAVVLSKIVNCKEQKHIIDISKLTQGVYSVKVDVNNNSSAIIKLVITR